MKKNIKIIIILIITVIGIIFLSNIKNNQIKSIHSEKQLYSFYENDNNHFHKISFLKKMIFLPFSIFYYDDVFYNDIVYGDIKGESSEPMNTTDGAIKEEAVSNSKDYSKTNIQVNGVDEADIIKTDGNYIFSISKRDVIITNAEKPNEIEISAIIKNTDESIPIDLIIHNDKLVVISSSGKNYYNKNTIIKIYDISDKENPEIIKNVSLYEPYYTTRCIDNKLYIFSKGRLREENNKIIRDYIEDGKNNKIDLHNIKYIKKYSTNVQTLICSIDLNNLDKNIKLESYLMDISNSYISKKSIYLLDESYKYNPSISNIFGFKGVLGLFDENEDNTKIFKFNIDKNKGITYQNRTKVSGRTINQYSLDENNDNLRIALESDKGTRIVIFDKNMKKIGESKNVAKGERMYASRFINNKAYLVTYQNTDPLFVVDLSDETNPQFMGELHIPGYSTYLHPYDDTHLIGIGLDTEETINRDSNGNVISNNAILTGMKMSLFDVSDINNPKEISKTTIGDSRTTSAILSNPKALLFSKKKNLLAIPVNQYDADKVVIKNEDEKEYNDEDDDLYSRNSYTAEGYFVYHIDLKQGFKLRGVINHDKSKNNYYYYNPSKLLRGLYIDNNLYTVSETAIKVHDIKTLKEINTINLEENGVDNYER